MDTYEAQSALCVQSVSVISYLQSVFWINVQKVNGQIWKLLENSILVFQKFCFAAVGYLNPVPLNRSLRSVAFNEFAHHLLDLRTFCKLK